MVEQWELYHADLDPTLGHEQRGERPVLVVSSAEFNDRAHMVIVVPLTTRKAGREVYPAEALIEQGQAGNPQESVALVHQMRSVDKIRLGRCYGRLTDEEVRGRVTRALRFALYRAL